MNSNLLRFIELASNAGLLEPVQSDRQLNSSPISNIDNLVHKEISLSLGDVNKLQTPNMVEDLARSRTGKFKDF